MKKIIYLSVLLAFIACKENKHEKVATMPLVETPKQWLVFEGSKENAKHIVLVSGDEEYRSEESMPMLAKLVKRELNAKVTVCYALDII